MSGPSPAASASGEGRGRAADDALRAAAILRAWDHRRAAAWSDGDVAALSGLYTRRSRTRRPGRRRPPTLATPGPAGRRPARAGGGAPGATSTRRDRLRARRDRPHRRRGGGRPGSAYGVAPQRVDDPPDPAPVASRAGGWSTRWWLSRPGDPTGRRARDHGPASATRPSTSTTTRSACARAARLGGRADHGGTALAQGRPELDLGGGVERGRHVVGEQQLGVAGQRPGQREPLHLTTGQPDAAVPDERVGTAGVVDVALHPGRLERRARPGGRGGRARRCRGRCRTARAAPGRRGRPGPAAGRPGGRRRTRSFQRISPVLVDQAGQRAEQAGLARADLTEQQHQLAGRRPSRSTSLTPIVPSSWTAVSAAERAARAAGRAGAGSGSGAIPCTRSTPGGRCIRSPPPASRLVARIHARVPGASVITEPATRPNQSKPLTAPATISAVARPQPPATSTAHADDDAAPAPSRSGRRRACACTRCSRTAASTRPPSTSRRWRWTSGVAAASLTVRTESSDETSDRPKRARAADDAAAERPATWRPNDEATRGRRPSRRAGCRRRARLPATIAVTTAIARPLTKSTQRSA